MTPKEKAKELVVKMSKSLPDVIRGFRIDTSKKYALICVDEILKNSLQLPVLLSTAVSEEIYWDEVKQEINKL